MKVAILSESEADEAAIRILIDAVLGYQTETAQLPPLRSRGWPSVRNILPSVLKFLHYQTDTDAFVLIVDSDDSAVHSAEHERPSNQQPDCRLCQLRAITADVTGTLRPVPYRNDLKLAIGVAVPAIEAWYQCGVNRQVSELAWTRKLQGQPCSYTRRSLKQAAYGTDRPSIEIETSYALQAATRLAGDLALLMQLFPAGFGALIRDVQAW
jgi:hypothetical protein